MVLAVDVSTALLGGSQPTSVAVLYGTEVTQLSQMLYHSEGASPLIMALVCGQYEAAAALIAAGAELTSRNARGCLVFFQKRRKAISPFFPCQTFLGELAGWTLTFFLGQSKD